VDIRSQAIKVAADSQYPDLNDETPGRRPSKGPSKGVERAFEAPYTPHGKPLDLDLDLDLHPSSTSETSVHPTDQTTTKKKHDEVVGRIVEHRCTGKTIANPLAYRAKAANAIIREHGDRITRIINQFPTAPVDVIAGAIETGDSRNLAHHTPPEPDRPLEELEPMTRTQRHTVLTEAGAPAHLIDTTEDHR
jgi:hypothetical protein